MPSIVDSAAAHWQHYFAHPYFKYTNRISTAIMPAPLLGSVVPDFEADTTLGPIKFHDFIHDAWAILSSHLLTKRLSAPLSSV